MGTQGVRLRINAWFGDNDIELDLPATWEVVECRMAGHDRPALSQDAVRDAVITPIGSPRLRELARGKQRVVILFDDLSKATPVSQIIPYVLDELHAGGIDDDQVRLLSAPGAHRPLLYPEFAAKLGKDIVARYPVYNHNVFQNLVYVGTTSRGTPVHVNREFASCDLRVGIGGITPHRSAGFGGGGKIVLPGVAGIETIDWHHKKRRQGPEAGTVVLGRVDDNVHRLDLEEAARLAGLDFKVDAVLNARREIVGLFAGDFVAAHRVGVKLAREIYSTEIAKDADVVIVNTYPNDSQFWRSTWCVPQSLREGGDVVIITYSYEGQNLHQWSGRFGTDYGGPGWKPGAHSQHLLRAGRTIVLAPHLSMSDRIEFGPPSKVVWCSTWNDVLGELTARNPQGAKVAIYPCAPLQVEAA